MLHFDVDGQLGAPRVVLVHGFTQTRRSWRHIASALAPRHQVLSVDAPGHGRSAHVIGDLWEGARRLGEVGGEAAYVGYSMGGRLVLHLAVAAPYLVRRVVLVGATAGIEDAVEREARRAADESLAAEIERSGVPAFLDRWLAGPLFATLPPDAAGVDDRLENAAEGLASSLRLLGTGVQEPLWRRLAQVRAPALFVAGELDAKFRALAERLAGSWGGPAAVAVVPGAGHAAHLERPDAFLELVRPFLDAERQERAIPKASSAP